jgi:hypothetical protein
VAEEIASAFTLGELRGRSLAEVLADALPAGALLVLDNCEHLIEACADQVGRILRNCRGLRILGHQPTTPGGDRRGGLAGPGAGPARERVDAYRLDTCGEAG